jgi:nucleotide-binding universal stress UspA family protein
MGLLSQAQPRSQVFKDELAGAARSAYRVLVPVANPATLDALVDFAAAVARRKKGEIIALHVVSQREAASPEEARRSAEGRRTLLEETVGSLRDRTVSIHTMTRLSDDPAQAILDTARGEGCNLIIMGWQGYLRSVAFGRSLGHVLDPVIAGAPCAVAIVKTKGLDHPRRLMVPTAGGPNAVLALDLALAFAWRNHGEVSLVTVVRKGQEEAGRRRLHKTLESVKTKQRVRQEVLLGDDAAKAILKESRDYDLIMLGATQETVFRQALFGTVPEHVAKRCPKTVIMVKGYQGPLVALVRQGRNRWQEMLYRLRGRFGSGEK